MSVKVDATGAAISGTGWAAGLIATLTETHDLFGRAPLLGFMILGALGGFAGWALLVESGKLDGRTASTHFSVLLRRISLGIAIGIAVGVWWTDSIDTGNKGLWMLMGGIIAAAPVELFRVLLDVVVQFIRSKSAK